MGVNGELPRRLGISQPIGKTSRKGGGRQEAQSERAKSYEAIPVRGCSISLVQSGLPHNQLHLYHKTYPIWDFKRNRNRIKFTSAEFFPGYKVVRIVCPCPNSKLGPNDGLHPPGPHDNGQIHVDLSHVFQTSRCSASPGSTGKDAR